MNSSFSGEVFITVLGFAFLFTMAKIVGDKRKKITHKCPRCGNICHASRWGTGLVRQDGGYVHKFHCEVCGNKFYY